MGCPSVPALPISKLEIVCVVLCLVVGFQYYGSTVIVNQYTNTHAPVVAAKGPIPNQGYALKTGPNCSGFGTTKEHPYEPSSLELEWTSNASNGSICDLQKEQINSTRPWVEYSSQGEVFHPKSKPAPDPTTKQKAALSRVWDIDRGGMEYIEPLTGVARHPRARVCRQNSDVSDVNIFDISYLVLSNQCTTDKPPMNSLRRNVFFDLGCTLFGSNPTPDTSRGSGRGPSIPMFTTMYQERCIDFDEIFAWEGVQYTASDWWKNIPVEYQQKIKFYNHYIEEGDFDVARAMNFSGFSESHHSFLRMFPLAVRPEDFVVLKIDIDGGTEMQIVHAIAKCPELADLVDEIFFEYHFYFDGENFGSGSDPNPGHTIYDVLALMNKLRMQGIRSHFCI